MSREEWLAARRKGIGGSDAAAVMGLNPYKSPVELYLEKIAEDAPPDGGSEAAYWGTVLEEPVARRYAELHPGASVRRNRHILTHPEHGYMLANIDREVRQDGETYGLEIKTASANTSRHWEDGNAPVWYVLQCQHYMAVTGWRKFVIAALIGGQTYVEREIPRDDAIIGRLAEQEGEFWRGVETRTPPEWDGSKSAWQVLRELYPKSVPGEAVRLPDALASDLKMYKELAAALKAQRAEAAETERRAEAVRQRVADAMGTAETGLLPGFKVTYKTVSMPEKVVKAYTYRRMTIKETPDA